MSNCAGRWRSTLMASASVSRGRSISQVLRARVTSRASDTALQQTGHVEPGFKIQLRPSKFDYNPKLNVNIAVLYLCLSRLSRIFSYSHSLAYEDMMGGRQRG